MQQFRIGINVFCNIPGNDLCSHSELGSMFLAIFQGTTYAAVQNWDQCFCGDSYGGQGEAPESDCNQPCKGDSSQMCGGAWRNSVYQTGKGYLTSQPGIKTDNYPDMPMDIPNYLNMHGYFNSKSIGKMCSKLYTFCLVFILVADCQKGPRKKAT